MEWSSKLYNCMPIKDDGESEAEDFTSKNGLPGYEFSVYVVNEETLIGAEAVVDNGDGTYSQTYYLTPDIWYDEDGNAHGAAVYYQNQMVFTGDLAGLPSFNYITLTYTFNSAFEAISLDIQEQYTAQVSSVSSKCTSEYHTDFEYGTEKAVSTAYEDYFYQYADKNVTVNPGDTSEELTASNVYYLIDAAFL